MPWIRRQKWKTDIDPCGPPIWQHMQNRRWEPAEWCSAFSRRPSRRNSHPLSRISLPSVRYRKITIMQSTTPESQKRLDQPSSWEDFTSPASLIVLRNIWMSAAWGKGKRPSVNCFTAILHPAAWILGLSVMSKGLFIEKTIGWSARPPARLRRLWIDFRTRSGPSSGIRSMITCLRRAGALTGAYFAPPAVSGTMSVLLHRSMSSRKSGNSSIMGLRRSVSTMISLLPMRRG